ncbi:YdiU family protein [Flavobacterium sp. H122]|uniref:protein adenylyltransferase SelO n=1 Tax=Flavobacterium sp. H122 TaxID=2529860 RepID=UPI0010A996A5|nr:YdiU family protein [Flavobacterium sp. H122]
MQLNIQNSFINELPADSNSENQVRKVFEAVFSFVNPTEPSNPKILHTNADLATDIGFSMSDLASSAFLNVFSGKEIYPNTKPFAMCYGGHQFGVWAGQLGDGRAINLFETENNQQKQTLQLKGAGKTPYSRNADGLAVLRSSVREYLCAEAMYHLGVPTTRSLSLITSGDMVLRDILYNGNPAYEKGAIVCRVAPSFIRFGNFEIFASRNDINNLKKLADFTIQQYFPEIHSEGKEKYLAFFKKVAETTLNMVVHWQHVGFVHGVMNTDNMSIHGITIDYGPYGWLEDYNPDWTPNTTDAGQRRYRYGNQPQITLWNLYQLANALYPLINETEGLEAILHAYEEDYDKAYLTMMRNKLGLENTIESDTELIHQLTNNLSIKETDYTIFFRLLSTIQKEDTIETALEKINYSFYHPEEIKDEILNQWQIWFENYLNRLQLETPSDTERKQKMNIVNPKYVLRNFMAQLAIEKADQEDYSLLNELFTLLLKPYDEQPQMEQWFSKRPDWAKEKVGCSMLSCSS